MSKPKRYLRTASVCERYQIVPRSVPRWVADGRLPMPEYRGKIPLWAEDRLDEHDRQFATQGRRGR